MTDSLVKVTKSAATNNFAVRAVIDSIVSASGPLFSQDLKR